jgi:hypothetical protein
MKQFAVFLSHVGVAVGSQPQGIILYMQQVLL